VLVNWGAMGPQPQATWRVPTSLQGNNAPVAVPNAPNVYVVANNSLAHILTGSLTGQFPNVHVFTWDLPGPIETHVQ
jgi:hypothetical protein